jgi:hypothetical protein
MGVSAGLVLLLIGGGVADAKKKKAKKRYAGAVTRTFTKGAVNLPIPESAPGSIGSPIVTDKMNISARGRILDVNIGVRVTHPDTTELDMFLEGPESVGAEIMLATPSNGAASPDPDFGAGAPDCTGQLTVFDDEAPQGLPDEGNPYVGSFKPTFSGEPFPTLDGFDGIDLRGTYEFQIGDSYNCDLGVLHCWQMTVKYKPPLKKKKQRRKKRAR